MTSDHNDTRNAVDRAAALTDEEAASADLDWLLSLRVLVHLVVAGAMRSLQYSLESAWSRGEHEERWTEDLTYRAPNEIVADLVKGVRRVHRQAVQRQSARALDTIERGLWVERVLDAPQPDVLREHGVYDTAYELARAVHQEARLNGFLDRRATFETMLADLAASARGGDTDRARALLPQLREHVRAAERALREALGSNRAAARVSVGVRRGTVDPAALVFTGAREEAELLRRRARAYERAHLLVLNSTPGEDG